MVVVLHNIRSLHNVGSIFRTADAVGIEKIYLCGVTPRPLDEFGRVRSQLAKVSLGAEKYVSWDKIKSTTRLLDRLKKERYRVLAIEQHPKSVIFSQAKKTKQIALILGSEVEGLPPPVLKKADQILEIPMFGKKESLNVSVAFGIVAYHLR
jgi:23S rRNA (guanosine2251-2'-O)-methyltransferase